MYLQSYKYWIKYLENMWKVLFVFKGLTKIYNDFFYTSWSLHIFKWDWKNLIKIYYLDVYKYMLTICYVIKLDRSFLFWLVRNETNVLIVAVKS